MTDNDDWHAGYREGLRDGRNISTELAPSQEVPVVPQCAREAIARKLAAWIGYSWDGLPDHSAVERGGFGEWVVKTSFYQGGKPDLLRLADAILAHPEPQCAQVPEETLADFLCNALDRAGPGCDELAIAQALLATYSVTRPERGTPGDQS